MRIPRLAACFLLGGSWIFNVRVSAHGHGHGHGYSHGEEVLGGAAESKEELMAKWAIDWSFSGISTFAHLKHIRCLTTPEESFDIGIIGAPFDTAVSYRPVVSLHLKPLPDSNNTTDSLLGARFGPRAIRAASARQSSMRGFNPRAFMNPYASWARILDCGDIPITPLDNAVALLQMTSAFTTLVSRPPRSQAIGHPRLITLGGDHSLALPALRALVAVYKEPITVLHFDAHLDTWLPSAYPSSWPSEQSAFNHGSMFHLASLEGLIHNTSSVHAGLRTRLSGLGDWEDDDKAGFMRISSDDIDDIGVKGVIESIMTRIGTERKVYLSIDIDVLDPGLAPGTGTPEPGGWTTRELIAILRGIEGLNLVGADIVEVAPAYDGVGEQTALAAAQIVYEMLTNMVKRVLRVGEGMGGLKDEL